MYEVIRIYEICILVDIHEIPEEEMTLYMFKDLPERYALLAGYSNSSLLYILEPTGTKSPTIFKHFVYRLVANLIAALIVMYSVFLDRQGKGFRTCS